MRRLYRYLRNYKGWAVLAFGSMIAFAVTQTAMIGLLQPIVDIGLTPPAAKQVVREHPSREQAIKNTIATFMLRRDQPVGQRGPIVNAIDDMNRRFHTWWDGASRKEQFHRILWVLFIVFVVRAFASFFSEYAFQKVGLSTVRDLRNELYERLIFQSHRFFSERSTGEMVSRIVSDADAIQAAVSTRMGDLFQESITLVGLIILVFWKTPELAVVTLLIGPLLVAPVVHFGLRLR
ncbi:MAG TPA: ABC transporter transmembrane domain-containing protein, partial [Thermoanaerobaculia bacterium]